MQCLHLPALRLFLSALCGSVVFCKGLLQASPIHSPVNISKSTVGTPTRKCFIGIRKSKVDDKRYCKSDGYDASIKSICSEIISRLSDNDQPARLSVLELGCGAGILWESMIEQAGKLQLELHITSVENSPELAGEAETTASRIVKRSVDESRLEITVVQSSTLDYIRSLDGSSRFDCAIVNHYAGDRSFVLRNVLMEALDNGIERIFITGKNAVGSEDLKSFPKTSIELAIETHRLPLILSKIEVDSNCFVALNKCRGIALEYIHRYKGTVSNGYGRGGKKLGVPTANLRSSLFQQALEDVDTGVYFGWAAIEDLPGRIFKAVVNVGYSPTFEGCENKEKIIEAHLILKDGEELDDFYGCVLRLKLLGYLRPEFKFESFSALITQINADKSDSDKLLDATPFQEMRVDRFFETSKPWIGSGGGDNDASWEFQLMLNELEDLLETMT